MRSRRLLLVGALALPLVALLIAGIGTAAAWGGPGGVMGGSWTGGPMGSGMMGGGQGMMGGWSGQGTQSQGQPITLDQAVKNVQAYVDQTGNKDLVVDEVMEFQYNFYAVVNEKSTGTGAFELLVNKLSGAVYPEMGPNMMWNTKYGMHASGASAGYNGTFGGMIGRGMMSGMMGSQYPVTSPTGAMTVTSDQAKSLAEDWLAKNQPGSTVEAPDQFYGYYTVHTLKEGKVSGMLSVNGYTGQVWYHTWHGAFVAMTGQGQ